MDLKGLIEANTAEVSAKDLRALLSQNAPLVAALAHLEQTAAERAANLVNADLSTDQGRLNAVKVQGEVRGLRMAIDLIGELAEAKTDG